MYNLRHTKILKKHVFRAFHKFHSILLACNRAGYAENEKENFFLIFSVQLIILLKEKKI